jgi:hypothetical protein
MTTPLEALIPIIQENLNKGDAARDGYYRHLGGLLREAETHFAPGTFLPWLRRQVKAGRFKAGRFKAGLGGGPSELGRLLGFTTLEDELLEALLMCARERQDHIAAKSVKGTIENPHGLE